MKENFTALDQSTLFADAPSAFVSREGQGATTQADKSPSGTIKAIIEGNNFFKL